MFKPVKVSNICGFLNSLRSYVQYTPLGINQTAENNLRTETNRLSKTLSKFWDQVTLNYQEEKITLQLDNKPICTPLGNPLSVSKNRQFLALMLHHEWSGLRNLSIKPHSLPLTSVVSRCIDLEMVSKSGVNPELVAKVGGDRKSISNNLLRYLDTDTLLCFSPIAECDGALRKSQNRIYLPIICAVEAFLTQYSQSQIKLKILDADLHGLRGNSQDQSTLLAARNYLDSLSIWDFVVFEKTVLTTKSFLCAILLLQNKTSTPSNDMVVTMEELAHAATLEITYQVAQWGEVEDTHDVDKRDIRRNINAAAIVAYRE